MKSTVLKVIMLISCITGAVHAEENITVQTQDNGAALVNPGMGWMMYFYSNVPANYGSHLSPADSGWVTSDQSIHIVYGGKAGGPWVSPEMASKNLFVTTEVVTGPAQISRKLAFPEVHRECYSGTANPGTGEICSKWRPVAGQHKPQAAKVVRPRRVSQTASGWGFRLP